MNSQIPYLLMARDPGMKLHEKIKTLRKERNLSQDDLAQKAGIHISYLSRLENGHNEPSVEVFKRLADALAVSADFLLDDQGQLEVHVGDRSLAERIRLIESLDEDDRLAVVRVIDAMLTKKRMAELLKQAPEKLYA